MLAKVTAACFGDKKVSMLIIDAKLQKQVGRGWRNVTSNRQTRYTAVKIGKHYVGRTPDLKCQKGTFRVMFRAAGKVDGKMAYGNWGAGGKRTNPCG